MNLIGVLIVLALVALVIAILGHPQIALVFLVIAGLCVAAVVFSGRGRFRV